MALSWVVSVASSSSARGLGRRSRSQVERYDWSGDPSAVLDSWFLFGPAEHDIVE